MVLLACQLLDDALVSSRVPIDRLLSDEARVHPRVREKASLDDGEKERKRGVRETFFKSRTWVNWTELVCVCVYSLYLVLRLVPASVSGQRACVRLSDRNRKKKEGKKEKMDGERRQAQPARSSQTLDSRLWFATLRLQAIGSDSVCFSSFISRGP